MRVAKFISIVLSNIALVAVVYKKFVIVDLQIDAHEIIIASAFFGGMLGTGINYFFELIYTLTI